MLSPLRSYLEGGLFVIGGWSPDKGQSMNYLSLSNRDISWAKNCFLKHVEMLSSWLSFKSRSI